MPSITQPYVWKLNDVATPALMNANPAGFVSAINNIDNGNIGANGIYASQMKPTTLVQATFGGTGAGVNYSFPGAVTVQGGTSSVQTNAGFLFTTATGLGVYAGTGAPTFAAPNGSMYYRYDSATTPVYINTSGASSSGTTWTGIPISSGAAYSAQLTAAISYTGTGSETNASPGTMATLSSFPTPASSPGANNNWRLFVDVFVAPNAAPSSGATPIGIGTATAGTTPMTLYGAGGTATHTISGGNCVSDWRMGTTAEQSGVRSGSYSAVYANSTTPTFTVLMGTQAGTQVWQGYIRAIAIPN